MRLYINLCKRRRKQFSPDCLDYRLFTPSSGVKSCHGVTTPPTVTEAAGSRFRRLSSPAFQHSHRAGIYSLGYPGAAIEWDILCVLSARSSRSVRLLKNSSSAVAAIRRSCRQRQQRVGQRPITRKVDVNVRFTAHTTARTDHSGPSRFLGSNGR